MKKRCSLLLALVMTLMLLVPALAAEEVKLPIYEQKQTFTSMVRKEDLSQNTWAEKECVRFTEELTNLHMEWIEVPNSGWDEKVNLTFASGDLPDLIIGGVDVVANMDTLAALDGLVDAFAPNVLRMFDALPDMRGALTLSDGHFYSLPIGDADVKNL
ncbi:MAG TPA: hypothetical protein PKE04_00190, partial [Clostridia bacterium]|nr:hypothetical protein [Clostridia bacterium]